MWPFKKKDILPLDLSPYRGNWVAVKKNKLLYYDKSLTAIMGLLYDDRVRGFEIWYESLPEEVKRWAVMYRSDPGHISPNCIFMDRESAERWMKSWDSPDSDAYLVTREGQHEPWVEVV